MSSLDPSTFEYLKPTEEQVATMGRVRLAAKAFAEVLERELPNGADKTFSIRNHRTTAMWANIAITRAANGAPLVDGAAQSSPPLSIADQAIQRSKPDEEVARVQPPPMQPNDPGRYGISPQEARQFDQQKAAQAEHDAWERRNQMKQQEAAKPAEVKKFEDAPFFASDGAEYYNGFRSDLDMAEWEWHAHLNQMRRRRPHTGD